MTCLRLRTPSRLHFGLLAWNPGSPRQFGGVGLMIDAPGLELTGEPAADWQAEGPLAVRALQVARRISLRLAQEGTPPPPTRFRIHHAAPEHVGLGSGTQLGLALARLLTELAGRPETPIATLAALAERGLRSGIGLHGFAHGGLIVDGGRGPAGTLPPLLSRVSFPGDWSVLVVLPGVDPGLHGPSEVQAFAQLPPIPDALTDRLCRLVLLGLLPAVLEVDLEGFGEALTELQHHVGRCFAPAQGGLYARPELEAIAAQLRAEGLRGVGQSSWGPALYAFSRDPEDRRTRVLQSLRQRFGLGPAAAFWTEASGTGATLIQRS
jgi:beta-ribofuranosylaminobenzene 5'-phosphate synthase